MKSISDNNEQVIEFKYIGSQDMIEEIRQLFLEYAESLGVDLNFQDFESEINSLPGKYEPPDGILILASVNGKSAGCVALRRLSKDICEMKRLYIRDEYRRLGIGKKLIVMIIEEAKKLKYRYMRLDTLPTMKKAQELYASLGFYDIEPYVYNPIEGTRFLELIL
ncbi:GNAT family N-acetyltransferase [Sedimentibacter hydroxybenzoicus DSM 7310]|uniref:GNAT family N-acetyltransferase n=1 Tax=Sedimentibacter hydroxybenzoicus DSM 7310 TaxID=1123245 RepID=A0A974BJ18_SEDHY|nr:GNAT family N-acetyltransferase [Sedimentibacter hydroxybenzoicus]NYB74160.1 GNAT family N-acetyltransferase [Sedimentibacter hydroxybenzoicus DSM 7310]